jgi:RNA-directed DNA polymerase
VAVGKWESRRDFQAREASVFVCRACWTRELTRRTRGVSIEEMAAELGGYLRGWYAYFGVCETPSVLKELDQWMRRRLRSFLWKQWKRGPVRFSELTRRGVKKDLAIRTVKTPHGPWHLAASPGVTFALPNAYFASLGIPQLFRHR